MDALRELELLFDLKNYSTLKKRFRNSIKKSNSARSMI